MTKLTIDMVISDEQGCRQHHLTLDDGLPEDPFREVPYRRRDTRFVGANAIRAARTIWLGEQFAFNAKRQLIRKDGKKVTRKWIAKRLERLFIFVYDGFEVYPPALEVMLELEMRVAWELAHPDQEYRR
jgi:hypothetical protein